jgi:hypothetical protein
LDSWFPLSLWTLAFIDRMRGMAPEWGWGTGLLKTWMVGRMPRLYPLVSGR